MKTTDDKIQQVKNNYTEHLKDHGEITFENNADNCQICEHWRERLEQLHHRKAYETEKKNLPEIIELCEKQGINTYKIKDLKYRLELIKTNLEVTEREIKIEKSQLVKQLNP